MEQKELESLVGESMEDMGLTEHLEERTCGRCGKLVEDDMPKDNVLCFECDASRELWQM